jgi:phytoene dehydrogenase-like protein
VSTDVVDAVVIGSGPNGLVAAALLARAGWSVTVLERASVAGGAVRSEALTVPGYVHDSFSAFYGVLHASPVFAELGLDRRVAWASFESPAAAMAAPGRGAAVWSEPDRTAAGLDPNDRLAWQELWRWWERVGRRFLQMILAPVGAPVPTARFLAAVGPRRVLDTTRMLLAPVATLARERFRSDATQVLLAAGISHSDVAVDQPASTPGALALAMVAQDVGMDVPVGGAGRLAEALVEVVREAGGAVVTGQEVVKVVVESGRAVAVETADGAVIAALRAVLADTGPPRLFLDLVGDRHVPPSYLDGIRRFRYGSGIFKLDLALDAPVRWDAEGLDRSGVVHITGDLDTMARSASEVRRGLLPAKPLLVVGLQTLADPSRAPEGGHTLWLETHVPPAPRGDGAERIDAGPWPGMCDAFLDRVLDRLEQHAPGLRSHVVGSAVRMPPDLEAENPNLVGGDLGGGSMSLDQQLVFRPVPGWFRYSTPVRGLYLCSASAHPGGGVHGMVGRNCARRVQLDARVRRI